MGGERWEPTKPTNPPLHLSERESTLPDQPGDNRDNKAHNSRAIAVDASGRAYVTGNTQATSFPTTAGAYQTALSGGFGQDAFVTRLNASGSALSYSTYLGGSASDAGLGIAVDGGNNAYVVGSTSSTNFPTASAVQASAGGAGDAFVARVHDGGTTLDWSTYLGGSGADQANGVALDADANVDVVGQTASTNFPTATPFQGSNGGGSDAFVTQYGQLLPPVFTAISPDTGVSSTDQVTTAQNLTLYGTALSGSTVTLYRAGLGQIGTATASGAGLWTFSYSGTTLPEGSYGFTGTATLNGKISPESPSFAVTVDETAPAVSLTVPATTVDLKPQVTVTATDLVGIAATTTVTLDVDLNNDGNFTDPGETGYETATMTNGIAVFALSPALSVGTVQLRARVTDRAGNQGTSAVSTLLVQATGSAWALTDTTPQIDPLTGDAQLQRGNLTLQHSLDLDRSPGTAVSGDPSLTYNSERTSAEPVIQATVQSDNSVALPSTITAQLTWNGTAQSAQTFNTTGLSAGDLLTLAQQVSSPVTTTGRYVYSLTVTMNYTTPIVRTLTGATFVDVEDSNPFGAGWTFGSTDSLVSVALQTSGTYTFAAGLERVYGAGGQSFYASSGGSYTSPAGDSGTLSAVGGSGYQYISADGRTWNFNSSGQETSFVSADGLATIGYTYSGSNLINVSSPDGALATIAYSGGVASTIQTDARTVTLTLASGNLTGIANPDGGLRTIVYDGNHHPTQDSFGSLSTTYAYSNRALSGTTPGDGGAFTLSPQSLFGLSALVAAPLLPSLTDPLGNVTREQLDAWGRPLQVVAANGGVTAYTRDGNGRVTARTDPVGNVTTYTLDASGYPTQITLPDGNTQNNVYQTAFHALTQFTDENGALTSYTYDAQGHTLTEKNALGQVTSYVYLSNGLVQSVTDPLGHALTYVYDTARRLSTTTDALGGVASVTYDANGNTATQVDQLGRTTTFVNDALGRVLSQTDPTGALTSYAYSGSGQTLSTTDALGRVTNDSYNTRGLLTSEVRAVGTAAQQSVLDNYDAAGRQTATRDVNGNWSYTGYDAVGQAISSTNALGGVTATVFDLAGRPTRSTDALGAATNSTFNSRGWVTRTVDALGNGTTTTYDKVGNVLTTVDSLGNTVTFAYDGLNRQVTRTDAAGTATTVYDAAGNVYQQIDALGRITQYDHDALNRVTTMTLAKGTSDQQVTTYALDKVGNQVSMTDPRGIVTNQTFDGANRITVQTQAAGTANASTTTTVYDAAGNATSVVDSLGHTASMGYDALNRQVTQTAAVGTGVASTATTVYDAVGNVVGSVDGLGHVNQTAYDQLGRPAFAIDALGNASRSYLGATGSSDASLDANGNRSSQTTDALGRVVASTDALGNVTTTIYDAAGNVQATVDPLGNRTTFAYDSLNRQISVRDATGHLATTIYDAAGNVSARVDQNGNRTTYNYDNLNRQIAVTDALGHTATTIYDQSGNVQVQVDANGNRTTFAYDSLNRQIAVTDALGHTATTIYDNLGNVSATVDANGNRTTFSYDAQNRLIQTQDALLGLATVVYDAAGNRVATVDARGNRTTFGYDAQNRVVSTTDPLNHTTTVVFDSAGNQIASIDALGNATTYGYDALNRRVSVQDPGGGIATTVYDADGNVVNTIDQLGNKGTFAYDALNRQIKAVDALSGTTSYIYDAVGNRTVVVDPVGNRTTFVYDAVNRVTQETDPLGNSATYAYDAGNRQTSQTDRLGRRDDFSYDGDNRVVTEVMRDNTGLALNTLTYAYDNNGNQLTAADSHGTYTMAYDALNRTSAVNGLFGVTLTNTYDAVGNRTAVKDSFGGTATSVYDAANHLTSKQFTDGTTPLRFDLAYTASDQVSSLTRYSDLAGTTRVGVSSYAYDAVGRVQNIQHKNGTGTLLANYTYTYDLASRVTAEKLNGTATSYSYDTTSQLTNDGSNGYSYDANGNRTMTGYTTGTGNQLTNDGVYTYTYDAEGNLTKKSKGASAETWTYSYDNRNQLIGVQERATDGGTLLLQATYTYDVFNRRIQEDKWVSGVGSTTVRLAYDSDGTVFADLNGSNALQTRYWYRPDAVAPVARLASGSATWLLEDRLGSVRNSADGTGALTGTVVYDGFGKITTETSVAATGRDAYTGLFQDRDIGTAFAGARVYFVTTGRWGQEDPSQFTAGDPSLYRYVDNNPTNGTDPSGLQSRGGSWDGPRLAPADSMNYADTTLGAFNRFAPQQQDVPSLTCPSGPSMQDAGWTAGVQYVQLTGQQNQNGPSRQLTDWRAKVKALEARIRENLTDIDKWKGVRAYESARLKEKGQELSKLIKELKPIDDAIERRRGQISENNKDIDKIERQLGSKGIPPDAFKKLISQRQDLYHQNEDLEKFITKDAAKKKSVIEMIGNLRESIKLEERGISITDSLISNLDSWEKMLEGELFRLRLQKPSK